MSNVFSPRTIRRRILGALPQKTGADNPVVAQVMRGFRMTLEDSRIEPLKARLDTIEVDARGFAYEGVGVALVVLDTLTPWHKRFRAFVRITEDQYLIPTYIGAGLALGRMHSRRVEPFVHEQEHAVFGWMVMDGFGFYKGFYTPKPFIDGQRVPQNLGPYARRVFDQGLGRGVWFARGENIERVAATIASFPEARRADIWSGASFACAYAGRPRERADYERLHAAAGPYAPQLALAGALAAKRRLGLGHITDHTDLACEVFCGCSAAEAAALANTLLADLPATSHAPLHQVWRDRITAAIGARTLDAVAA